MSGTWKFLKLKEEWLFTTAPVCLLLVCGFVCIYLPETSSELVATQQSRLLTLIAVASAAIMLIYDIERNDRIRKFALTFAVALFGVSGALYPLKNPDLLTVLVASSVAISVWLAGLHKVFSLGIFPNRDARIFFRLLAYVPIGLYLAAVLLAALSILTGDGRTRFVLWLWGSALVWYLASVVIWIAFSIKNVMWASYATTTDIYLLRQSK